MREAIHQIGMRVLATLQGPTRKSELVRVSLDFLPRLENTTDQHSQVLRFYLHKVVNRARQGYNPERDDLIAIGGALARLEELYP